MQARLQRRVQRYGWDRAVRDYESSWLPQLKPLHDSLLDRLAVKVGERVLDVACGTGHASLQLAVQAGAGGSVVGIDLSTQMVSRSRMLAARELRPGQDAPASFLHMDAETLLLDTASVDVVLCSLGLMYVPDPALVIQEMHRVLAPGGRTAIAVWADRAHCGWSSIFDILADETTTDVCPQFFQLGQHGALASRFTEAGFKDVETSTLAVTLDYASTETACTAAFMGGPATLAWSRLSAVARQRVKQRYLASLDPFRHGDGFRIPAEFLILHARAAARPAILASQMCG